MKVSGAQRLIRLAGGIAAIAATLLVASPALAEEQSFYLGSTVNAGLDTGYSESNEIAASDPHFGWQLGSFNITGYTAVQRDGDSFTFLKTVGEIGRAHV